MRTEAAFSEKVESSAKPLGLMRCTQEEGSMPGRGVQVGAEVGAAGPTPRGREAPLPAHLGKWIFAI